MSWSRMASAKVLACVLLLAALTRAQTTNPTTEDNYFNVGVQYEPVKIVDFALVYKRDKVDNGTVSTQNGTIGGSINGTYDEFGLWGQFRW